MKATKKGNLLIFKKKTATKETAAEKETPQDTKGDTTKEAPIMAGDTKAPNYCPNCGCKL